MIKFKLRKNLIYLLVFLVSFNVRGILFELVADKFDLDLHFTFLFLMCIAEILGGLGVYLFQHFTKRNNKETKFFAINSVNVSQFFKGKKVPDSIFKVAILLFFSSFFDLFEFISSIYFVPLASENLSYSMDDRLSSIQLISSALICTYALGFKMKKHHKFALTAIGICLILTLVIDGIFINGGSAGNFLSTYALVFYYQIIFSFNCCIEKYLVDVDFMNPFKIIMCEGIIMFVMAIIISIGSDPLKELRDAFKDKKSSDTALIIFLVTLLFILSIVVNVYKVYCNAVYSPMARSLAHFIINPLFNILYFFTKDDFSNNILCLIISEIICIATDFFAFVYNEYLILFCCDLEVETVDVISERASLVENIPLNEINEEEEEEEEEEKEEKDDNKDNINKCKTNKKINNNETVIVLDNYSFSI